MSLLFEPLDLRGVTVRNRIGVSPMCQFSAVDGVPNDWHLVHLASRAVGGAGLVLAEATAVEPRGRISPGCLGLWDEAQVDAFARISRLITSNGAVPGIQLAHAGRRASMGRPTDATRYLGAQDGGWPVVGPSATPYEDGAHEPTALSVPEIAALVAAFADAADRAVTAGFRYVELHAAHGYLLHSFLSPLTNQRDDAFGGDRDARSRFLLEVVAAVRRVLPDDLPLAVRLSASDERPGGWSLDDSVALAERLREAGVDLVVCSAGGALPDLDGSGGTADHVDLAGRVRAEALVPTAALGSFSGPEDAEDVLVDGLADLVLLRRESLRDPYWPLAAAHAMDVTDEVEIPWQYVPAFLDGQDGTPLE